jgi:vitamin B12 transporter
MRRVAFALLLLLPGTLSAQIPASDSVYEIAPLVVTPERAPMPAGMVTGSVTVLQGGELRARGVRSVADALREVPGASVVSGGSFGAQTSLFLRGGESDYTKVLIDGVAMNQPGGAFNFNALTLDNVERIEVVRGPASVLYGTDAMTGVVQIITRDGRGPASLDLTAQGGTFGTRRILAALSSGSDRFGYSAAGSTEKSDGTYPFNNEWQNNVGTVQARLALGRATTLRGSFRYAEDNYHFPTNSGGLPVDSNAVNRHDATTFSLGLDQGLGARWSAKLLATVNQEGSSARNAKDSPGDTLGFGFASASDADLLRRAFDARVTFTPSGALSLTGGVEFLRDREERHEGYAISNFGFGIDTSISAPVEHARGNTGAYLQALLQPRAGLSLSAGARLDDNEGFGRFVTGKLGAIQHLGSGTRIRGTIGTAFKTPTLEESYGNSPFSIGDPELEPETSTSWEIGAEHDLLAGRLTLGAVWFDQRFEEMIQYDGGAAPGDPTYANVAAATSRGLDLSLVARPTPVLSIDLGYTYLKTEVTDAGFSSGSGDVFVEGEELIRRPSSSGRLGVSWLALRRATLGAQVTYVGSRSDVDFGPFPSERVELPGYTLLDLSADLPILGGETGGSLAVTFRAENLLDESYDTVVGFPGRGRTLIGGLRAHW